MRKLAERMAVLIKADAHGVLDSLEERGLLAKQYLREAELELDRKRARIAALEDEERARGEDATKLEAQVAALDDDVELALAGGKEDLARFAVRRLLPLREALEALRVRAREIAEERARVAERLAIQERQFEALRARVRAHLAQARAQGDAMPFEAPAVAEEEIDLELMRRRRRAEGREEE